MGSGMRKAKAAKAARVACAFALAAGVGWAAGASFKSLGAAAAFLDRASEAEVVDGDCREALERHAWAVAVALAAPGGWRFAGDPRETGRRAVSVGCPAGAVAYMSAARRAAIREWL